jgi:riboflavin synthase
MFTGIIEALGEIIAIHKIDGNIYLQVKSKLSSNFKIDQSVAHNGICLTVTAINNDVHTVCAVPETILKTTIAYWQIDDIINLEQCMQLNARLDGHIVQGHVDAKAKCIKRTDNKNSWNYTFQIPHQFAHLIVEKGSITINGTSLTCFNITNTTFEVAIIPYTFEHTSIYLVNKSSIVNIEFDIIGKYVARLNTINSPQQDV